MVKEDLAGFIPEIHNILIEQLRERRKTEEKGNHEVCTSEVVRLRRFNSHLTVGMVYDLRWGKKRFQPHQKK